MRDILFKAKTEMIVGTYNNGKKNGEWVEGYLRCDCGKWIIYQFECDRGDQIAYEVNPDTICQYTGFTDDYGNKIWENDIVWIDATDRAIVIFSEKYSGYILEPIGDFYFDSPMLVDNVDIIDNCIGNKFDNPKLLGV